MRCARRHSWLLTGFIVAGGVGLLATAGAASANPKQIPVLTGPADQETPAASGATLSWAQSDSAGGPNEYVPCGLLAAGAGQPRGIHRESRPKLTGEGDRDPLVGPGSTKTGEVYERGISGTTLVLHPN